MRIHEMRELSPEDLQAQINDTRREMVQLRFQLSARKLESPAKLKMARQKLSRLLTIQHQAAAKEGKVAAKLPQVARSVRSKLHDLQTGPARRKSSVKSRMSKSVARRMESLKSAHASLKTAEAK